MPQPLQERGEGPKQADDSDAVGRRPRALVVDDSAANRMVAAQMLQDAGFSVVEAPDGAAGAAIAQDQSFDLIVMDIQMPVLDGYGAARLIRGIEGQDRTPIIAWTSEPDRHEAARAGMDDVLPKPTSQAVFRSMVEKWTT